MRAMLLPCNADPGPLNWMTGNIVPGRFCKPMADARLALMVVGYAPFWFRKRLNPQAARFMILGVAVEVSESRARLPGVICCCQELDAGPGNGRNRPAPEC